MATAVTPTRSDQRGFHGAEVSHRVERRASGALLRVTVRAAEFIAVSAA